MTSQPDFLHSSVWTVLAGERPLSCVSPYVTGHMPYIRRLRAIATYLTGVLWVPALWVHRHMRVETLRGPKRETTQRAG